MTIWLLAFVLLGLTAAAGYRLGAIRVAFSIVGILMAGLLAGPLSGLVKPMVAAVGIQNPILLWVLPSVVVFIVVFLIFRVISFPVHRKVDVHFRHRAGDLRQALWERLNARGGLCLGLINGLCYLVVISMVIYPISYLTVQVCTSDEDGRIVKIVNRLGRDLQSTGMARVAKAVDPMPEKYYDAADLAGLIFQNSLLEARLSRYPAFLSLGEKPEFQALGQDRQLAEMRLRQAPLRQVLDRPAVQAIVENPNTLNFLWSIVGPDLKDLRAFLEKGKSEKYGSEPILGRWSFDLNASLAAFWQDKPNISSTEMQRVRQWMAQAFAKTTVVVAPDNQVFLKDVPTSKPKAESKPLELETLNGHWKNTDGEYELVFEGDRGKRKARIANGRLMVTGGTAALVFARED